MLRRRRRVDAGPGRRPESPDQQSAKADEGSLWPSLALRGAKESPGAPLDVGSREYFEPRFGDDFSDVRIHTGPQADASARAAQARAFTSGSDIVFADGRFSPHTPDGQELLGHELTHVIQQRRPGSATDVPGGDPDAIGEATTEHGSEPNIQRQALPGGAFPGSMPRIDYVSAAAVVVIDSAGKEHVLTPSAFADEWSPGNAANSEVAASNAAYGAAWRQIVPSHGIPIHGDRPAADAGVSAELSDAPAGSTSAERVMGWLQAHKAEIEAAEADFGIDRRAIAGAIAWEALENVRSSTALTTGRFAGPGKVHVKSSRVVPAGIKTFGTVAEEAEAASILPKAKDVEAREKLLATPAGAIRYVGGIMKLGANIALSHGFDIHDDPKMLCFFFQAMDSDKWEKLLKKHTKGTPLTTPEPMATWVTENLPFLEAAVGKPALTAASAAAAPAAPAGPDLHGPPTAALKDRAIALSREIAIWVAGADVAGPAAITVSLVRDGDDLSPSYEAHPEPHYERPSSRAAMSPARVLGNLEPLIDVWVAHDGVLKAEWTRDTGGYMQFSYSITPTLTPKPGTHEPAAVTP